MHRSRVSGRVSGRGWERTCAACGTVPDAGGDDESGVFMGCAVCGLYDTLVGLDCAPEAAQAAPPDRGPLRAVSILHANKLLIAELHVVGAMPHVAEAMAEADGAFRAMLQALCAEAAAAASARAHGPGPQIASAGSWVCTALDRPAFAAMWRTAAAQVWGWVCFSWSVLLHARVVSCGLVW